MKTIKFLSMAALALVGTMTVGCSSEDNFIEQTQQSVNSNNVVTLTATVGFDEAASNRALAIDYTNKKLTKTFKAGDKIAVVYQNTSDQLVKVETTALTDADITAEGKSATFTVSMTDPKASGTLKYIYPAAMAGATDVDYTKLNSQDGTLATLASNLDLATFEGTLTAAKELPASASLTNKLAILALTFKNSDGTSDLIGINKMALSDGTNSYSITGKDTDGHIYAAIKPTSGANIDFYATDGTNNYMKSVTSKTYAANNIYQQGLKMDPGAILSLVTSNIVAQNGETITGTLGTKVQISIADGATVTLKDANINGSVTLTPDNWAGITCEGDATINLEGTNTVKGFINHYPGIYVPSGNTLTIDGTGSLDATGRGNAAGIGGGGGNSNKKCGAITISGGTVTATGGSSAAGIGGGYYAGSGASCGDITISGGTVTAMGGNTGAGIGSGYKGTCGNILFNGGTITATGGMMAAGIGSGFMNGTCGTITITSGVTSVTATKGGDGAESIGAGNGGTCGTVTIDGVANATTSSTFPNFNSSVSGDTWTLTHK